MIQVAPYILMVQWIWNFVYFHNAAGEVVVIAFDGIVVVDQEFVVWDVWG